MLSTQKLRPSLQYAKIHMRNYAPNQYSAGHFSYDTTTATGKKIPPHELSHRLLQRNQDGKIVGLLTTEPKNTFESKLIDNKELINGKVVNNNEKGQYITAFNKPKIIDMPGYQTKKPIFIVDKKCQEYLDKREHELNSFYESRKHYYSEVRLHKEDSRFYNENGSRDYENFP